MNQLTPADGRTRRAEAQRESRRAHILRTSLEVFARRGYHSTRVSDIISEAGIARGTFYLYFESKSAIFLELLDQLLKQLRATIVGVEMGPNEPPIEQQLHQVVVRILRSVEEHRLLSTIILREAVGLDAEVDRRLRQFYGSLHKYIATSLGNGQRLGIVRDADTDVVASCVLGSIKQLAEQQILAEKGGSMDAERVATAVIDYNLRGILEPSIAFGLSPPRSLRS